MLNHIQALITSIIKLYSHRDVNNARDTQNPIFLISHVYSRLKIDYQLKGQYYVSANQRLRALRLTNQKLHTLRLRTHVFTIIRHLKLYTPSERYVCFIVISIQIHIIYIFIWEKMCIITWKKYFL